MKGQILYADAGKAITDEQLHQTLVDSLSDCKDSLKKVLLLVPDFTRYHSNAGKIANMIWHMLKDSCQVDLLEAVGTHFAMTDEQLSEMYGDIPKEHFIAHNWRKDVVKIGEVPREYVAEVSGGAYCEPVEVEINRRLFDGYDLILSIGQVVPHEVVGMANHSKNIFVGCGGSSMINSSHILSAFYGMEKLMGRDHSPVRKVFDYAAEHFLSDLPLYYILTVTTAPGGIIQTHGLFIGKERCYFDKAVALSQKLNMTFVDRPYKKIVAFLPGSEFKTTWVGNKAVYRSRMAIADGGELIVLAPGVETFGEDPDNDVLIRKYGYCGTEKVIGLTKTAEDLKKNLSAAAHLIQGSTDGRFTITYCVKHLTKEEVESVCFNYMPYDEAIKRYNPETLQPGVNILPDGEEIYFIPNPALGLWADKNKY